MYTGLNKKYRVFFSDFSKTCIFSTDFLKNTPNLKVHENPSTERQRFSMRTDEQTDRHDEANSRFSQFC